MSSIRPIKTDVLIIGGGLAGLSAAYHLNGSGLDVHLLEASNRLGGRTWGHYWDQANRHIDLGASWLTADFQHTIALAHRLGATTEPTPSPAQYFTHFSTGISEQRFPNPADVASLQSMSSSIQSSLASNEPEFANAHEALTAPGTPTPCRDWHLAMQRYLAGADLTRVDPRHLLLKNEDLIDPDHYGIEIRGSMRELVNALEEAIEAEVHRTTPVTAVTRRDGFYEALTSTTRTVHARSVVLAAPLNVLKHIDLDPQYIGAISPFIPAGHSGNSRKDWFVLTGVDQHIRVFASEGIFGYFRTSAQLDDGSMLAVGFAPAHEGLPIVSEFETQLRRYCPNATVEAHYSFDWRVHPWVAGTWITPPPGYYEALTALDNSASTFQLVGGDFSSDFPGTVEGAIMTGRQAALNLNNYHF